MRHCEFYIIFFLLEASTLITQLQLPLINVTHTTFKFTFTFIWSWINKSPIFKSAFWCVCLAGRRWGPLRRHQTQSQRPCGHWLQGENRWRETEKNGRNEHMTQDLGQKERPWGGAFLWGGQSLKTKARCFARSVFSFQKPTVCRFTRPLETHCQRPWWPVTSRARAMEAHA